MKTFEATFENYEVSAVEYPPSSSNFGLVIHHNLGTPFVSATLWHNGSEVRQDQFGQPLIIDENTCFMLGVPAGAHVRLTAA